MTTQRILLVDDSLPTMIALERHLVDMGYTVEKSTSAERAILLMLQRPVHCVIVDVDMPGISGLEFAQLVRKDPSLCHVPLMLITGKVFSENQALAAFRIGASDYLRKPVKVPLLKSKLQFLVKYSMFRQELVDLHILLEQSSDELLSSSDADARTTSVALLEKAESVKGLLYD